MNNAIIISKNVKRVKLGLEINLKCAYRCIFIEICLINTREQKTVNKKHNNDVLGRPGLFWTWGYIGHAYNSLPFEIFGTIVLVEANLHV